MILLNPVCYKMSFQGENININGGYTQLWLKSTIVFTHKIVCFIYPFVNITTCVIIENSVSRSSAVDEGGIYFIEFCQLMFFKNDKKNCRFVTLKCSLPLIFLKSS